MDKVLNSNGFPNIQIPPTKTNPNVLITLGFFIANNLLASVRESTCDSTKIHKTNTS